METITNEAKEARAKYLREYRKNRTEEQKEKERKYARDWRRNNPDKVKDAHTRYWNKKAEEMMLYEKEVEV